MTSPKATLGYPTRTAAVQALRAEGLSTKAIAARIGIEPNTVTALEASAARQRGAPPGPARRPVGQVAGHTVELQRDVAIALRPHAARRNISVDTLVRRIVDAALDGMVDAILDDGADMAERAA